MMKFHPLLKTPIWGGEKIVPFKHLHSDMKQVGESWEVSGIPGSETVVSEGEYAGLSLNEVVAQMKERLLGKANYQRFGNEFPLLVKFIDARHNLSIQVHPDDDTAQRHGKQRGKTEMWYVLDSDADAFLYNGLKKNITLDEYQAMVSEGTICDALASYSVHEGDVFFIPAGRIHSIGQGTFLVEIQQTSDVTYRIYDFKRRDKNGHYRQLHTREASESINFTVLPDYQTHYSPKKNERVALISCPFFTTAVYDIDKPMTIDYSQLDSFIILVGVKGSGTITDNQGNSTTLNAGETILLPALTQEVKVAGQIKFLETFI